MPNVRQVQSNLNAGELSPKVMGRVDLAKYFNGLETLENFSILPYGGVTRSPGTDFIAETKTSSKRSRLFPFEYSVLQAYVLEFGDLYVRFYKNGALLGNNAELITNGTFLAGISGWTDYSTTPPYDFIAWDSANKRMSMVGHRVIGPPIIVGYGIGGQSFATTAGHAYSLTLSAYGVVYVLVGSTLHGSNLLNTSMVQETKTFTFTASGATTYIEFQSYNGGEVSAISVKEITVGGIVEVATPYTEGDLPLLRIAQSADVLYLFHPSYATRKLERITETSWKLVSARFYPPPTSEHPIYLNATLAPAATTGASVNFTPSADVFVAGDVGRQIVYNDSLATILSLSVDAIKKAVCTILVDFPDINPIAINSWGLKGSPAAICTVGATPGSTATWSGPVGAIVRVTLSADGFRLDKDGLKYIWGNGGLIHITSMTSATVADGELIKVFNNVTGIIAGAWTLESEDWSVTDGYPSTGCFFEQRLFVSGVPEKPATVWGSKTGDYENFARGSVDSDSVVYPIASNVVNTVLWLLPTRALIIGTAGGEFRATGGADLPLTPSNVDIVAESTYGSSIAAPLRIKELVLFVQRAQRKLRDLRYTSIYQPFESNDLTILAEHITLGGIIEIAYQQEPLSQIWAVRGDGVLLSMTIEQGQDVVGWSRKVVDGSVESVTSIPSPQGTSDDVWIIVNRTVNGLTKRYVERLDTGRSTDCGILYSGVPATVITGLSHLEGKPVAVVADGIEVTGCTVSSGQITLPVAASVVEVGLPFTPRLVTVRPEVTQGGTAQGLFKRWVETWVRLLDTQGLTINGQAQETSVSGVGDIRVVNLGSDREAQITIEQTHPFPATILSIFGTLEVEG